MGDITVVVVVVVVVVAAAAAAAIYTGPGSWDASFFQQDLLEDCRISAVSGIESGLWWCHQKLPHGHSDFARAIFTRVEGSMKPSMVGSNIKIQQQWFLRFGILFLDQQETAAESQAQEVCGGGQDCDPASFRVTLPYLKPF